ncbi:hypothetical protein ACFU76_24855, partial [Streptomyces sp. NPDC057539]
MSHSPAAALSALSPRRVPALAAVTAAALLAATGCSDNSGTSAPGSSHGGNTRSTDRPKDLATQRLTWKACKAPSVAEGGVAHRAHESGLLGVRGGGRLP